MIREVVEGVFSGVVLGFFGGPKGIHSVEVEAIDCNGGGETRDMIEANLGGVVLWQPPFSLLAELLQPRLVHRPFPSNGGAMSLVVLLLLLFI